MDTNFDLWGNTTFEVFDEFKIENGKAVIDQVVVKDNSHRIWFRADPHMHRPAKALIELLNALFRRRKEGTLKYSKADIDEAINDIECAIEYHSQLITQYNTKCEQLRKQSEHLHRAKLAFDILDDRNQPTDAAVKACP